MKRNVGGLDRLVRIVVGLVVLPMAWIGPHSAWALLGLLPLATGLLAWCPPYGLFGFSTRRGAARHREPAHS